MIIRHNLNVDRSKERRNKYLISKIKTEVERDFQEIVDIRRDIHRNPELGKMEVRTSRLIQEKLKEFCVDQIETPCPTAVVGIIHGTLGKGKCIAVRCDIDALPISEETGLPYASQVPGIMHACGHDMHTAILLGAAKVLSAMRNEFRGSVKLIFQHSEDTLPGGAKELVEKGVMINPKVDAILGIHMLPDKTRVGQIGVHAGPLTTSVDLYDVTVKGKGGHGSAPQTANDPILAACQMIVILQQIVARRIDPLESAIFSIGSIHSGDAPNIIPGEAKFSGIARAYSDAVRKTITKQFYEIAGGIEMASGCKININHYEGYPSVVNDKYLIELACSAICNELGNDAIVELPQPLSFSEDFSYYTKLTGIPGAYLVLFGGHEGELTSLHNSKCILREEAMPSGITALASTVIKYLNS